MISELRESSGKKIFHKILISVHLSALISWHFTVSHFSNQSIYNDFNCLHKSVLVSMVPFLYFFFPEFLQLLFGFRWWNSYKSVLCFACCSMGKLLASSFMRFTLCVKTEIVFFCSHFMLQTQSEHLIHDHDSYLADLSFLLIILPQYTWHANQFNLIS